MRILISGSNGFIGSNLSERLMSKGIKIDGIAQEHSTSFKIYQTNLKNLHKLKKMIKKNYYDVAIHLAGKTEETDMLTMFEDNVLTTLNFLEVCRSCNIPKLIFASGHNVYSPSKKLPINENFPRFPNTNYGMTKALSEDIVRYYSDKFNISSIVLRLSFTYGRNQKSNRMISRFIGSAKNYGNIELHKYMNGFQKMDIIHVDDVCDAIFLATKSRKKFAVYNIASGKSITVKDIAKTIFDCLNMNYNFKVTKIGNKTNHFSYDITKAKKELGFIPKKSLGEGISELVKIT